jgi:hypothetical protein
MEMRHQIHIPAAFTRERMPVRIKQEKGWTPELVWTFWRTEKYFAPNGIRTPDSAARTLASEQTTLYIKNFSNIILQISVTLHFQLKSKASNTSPHIPNKIWICL